MTAAFRETFTPRPRRPFPGEVRTYENTSFLEWWKMANKAFARRDMPEPTYGPARDAYEFGESPQTWADYVKNS